MLIDDYLSSMQRVANVSGRPGANDPAMVRELTRAQRFVLSPLCVQTIDDLASVEAAERSRDYVFAPAENTWIEWSGGSVGVAGSHRHGILLMGADQDRRRSLLTGDGQFVFDAGHLPNVPGGRMQMGIPIVYDFPGDDTAIKPQKKSAWDMLAMVKPEARKTNFDELSAWVIAALALVNTPRLAHTRDAELGKLNRARIKKDRPPILEYKEVSIHVDSGELGNAFKKATTDGRALHHVRAFLRLRKGKVEIVRPHLRGNPRFGVIVHRYVALRAEDEAGTWKGGPMPPPKIIDEMTEP